MKVMIDKLAATGELSTAETTALLYLKNKTMLGHLFEKADAVRRQNFVDDERRYVCIAVNGCPDVGQILACAREAYAQGVRAFVLQSGDGASVSDNVLCDAVREIKENCPECALTLALGERSFESYRALRDAGADGYVFDCTAQQKQALEDLKYLGYRTGVRLTVGAPGQTAEQMMADLRFLKRVSPEGLCLAPLDGCKDADLLLILKLTAILRLTFPQAVIAAHPDLEKLHPQGVQMGIAAGANMAVLKK